MLEMPGETESALLAKFNKLPGIAVILYVV
jgi:hypothetical protein